VPVKKELVPTPVPKQLPIGKIKKKETVEAQHTVTVEEEGRGAVGYLAANTIRKHP
jgi:hypothetical protein